MIPPRAHRHQTRSIRIWRFLYKVSVLLWSNYFLICSYSSLLGWKCFIFGAIVYWKHLTYFLFYRSLRRHSALIPFEQCSGTAKKYYETLWSWTEFILHNEMAMNLFGGRLCLKGDMFDVKLIRSRQTMTDNVDCQLDLESPRDKSLQMFLRNFLDRLVVG